MITKRRFKDSLHGSISVSELENNIIDHPLFQRLRRIKQTAFLSAVFPCANHTRFEHSLGTMHMAKKAWDKIKENQSRILNSSQKKEQPSELKATTTLLKSDTDYLYTVLRLTALLHDVGHPPLSHTGEHLLQTKEKFLQYDHKIPKYLRKYLESPSGKISHEVYSVLLCAKIIEDINISYNKEILTQDIASVLLPGLDSHPDSPIKSSKTLISDLVCGDIGVDRMDYLLRDSKQCGVYYGIFDWEKILDSMLFYLNPDDNCYHLGLKSSAIPAFEDYLRARQSMYVQVYFHRTSGACEAMLRYISRNKPNLQLPIDCISYSKIDDNNIYNYLDKFFEKNDPLKPILKELFLDRKLWKQIYENTDDKNFDKKNKEINELLQKMNIDFSAIENLNYLSNSYRSLVENPLRVVKKDSKQTHQVYFINDFTDFYKKKTLKKLYRIYTNQATFHTQKKNLLQLNSSL
jgi:uncharacterized protein